MIKDIEGDMSNKIFANTIFLFCMSFVGGCFAETTEQAIQASSSVQKASDSAADGAVTYDEGQSSGYEEHPVMTGFHAGISVGMDRLGCKTLADAPSEKDKKDEDGKQKSCKRKKKKSGSGFNGEMLMGYDYQTGIVFAGVEGVANMRTPKVELGKDENCPDMRVSRRIGFGVTSRIGAVVCANVGIYAKFGVDISKYKINSAKKSCKKSEKNCAKAGEEAMNTKASKAEPRIGLGAEYRVGAMFARVECDKSIHRRIKTTSSGTRINVDSMTVKIGGGCVF
jgi:hypothetical protein